MDLGRAVSGRHWSWWRDGLILLKRKNDEFRANLNDKRGNEGGQADEDVSLVQEGSKRGQELCTMILVHSKRREREVVVIERRGRLGRYKRTALPPTRAAAAAAK